MLLAIDIGNSNVTLGVFQGQRLRMRGKASVQTRRSADEYAAMFYDLLRLHGIGREEIDGCILSSVVPAVTGLVEEAARTVAAAPVVRGGTWISLCSGRRFRRKKARSCRFTCRDCRAAIPARRSIRAGEMPTACWAVF